MRESQIKLSVCIPTLNRGHLIAETLDSIVSQLTEAVEVVIVDGGSTDNTSEVVSLYTGRFPNVRYNRQEPDTSLNNSPSNAGFDRDCSRAVELARGKYCWLFTDDDLIKPFAIDRVLRATENDYAAIIANAEVRSGDLAKRLQASMLSFREDRVYKASDAQLFFTEIGNYLRFVGGLVIKRDLWIAREKEKYFGSGFIHAAVVFQSPILQAVLVIAEPLVTVRYGDALYMRSPRYFEIWMFSWPNLIWSFRDFPDSAKQQLCRKEPWRRKRTLLLFRAVGAFSIKEYRRFLEGRLTSKRERFNARLIASCPGSLANCAAVLHCCLFRLPGQFLVDLVKSPFFFARGFRWPRLLRQRIAVTVPSVPYTSLQSRQSPNDNNQ